MASLQLFIYFLSFAMIALGAVAFVHALSIPTRLRAALACLAASVPVVIGVWFFRSARLHPGDLESLLRQSGEEMDQVAKGIKDRQGLYQELQQMLK